MEEKEQVRSGSEEENSKKYSHSGMEGKRK
jgi:hypothetical protein